MKMRHIIHRSIQILRSSSSFSKGTGIGFESSLYANPMDDCTLLEKSIRNGCRSIMARGKGDDSNTTSIFELLVDLALTEDIELDKCSIGYSFQPGVSLQQKEATIQSLASSMGTGRKMLDYVHIPVGLTSTGSLDPATLQEHSSLQKKFQSDHNIQIGFDLSTSTLAALSPNQIGVLSKSLSAVPVSSMAIATNFMTTSQCIQLHDWAKQHSVYTISTEVLRVHPRRPALMVPPSGHPQPFKDLTTTAAMQAATEELKHAVDRCLVLEKHFLDKLRSEMSSPDVVAVTYLCWAHLIAQTQQDILSPEEWTYLLTHKITPTLEEATDKIRLQSRQLSEWASLHSGLAKYVFNSMSTAQERRRVLCMEELMEHCKQDKSVSASSIERVECLPGFLAGLAGSIGGDVVMLAGCAGAASGYEPAKSAAEYKRSHMRSEAERVLLDIVKPVAERIF